jgi:hypothetical protein
MLRDHVCVRSEAEVGPQDPTNLVAQLKLVEQFKP